MMNSKTKPLSVFSLVMINIIAIDNIRSLSGGSSFGLLIIPIYLVLGLCFFIPVALISAELATGWPKRGGIYVWVREALGHSWGLWVIFLQWIYNVIWYPSQVMFILGALQYLMGFEVDGLSPLWHIVVTSGIFIAITMINIRGMRLSSLFSNIGAVIGTLIPIMVLVVLTVLWLLSGHQPVIHLTGSWWPKNIDVSALGGYLTLVIFGLVGIEMSAVHADEVASPQKAYPKAIMWSMLAILVSLSLGTLALAVMLPAAAHDERFAVFEALKVGFASFTGAFVLSKVLVAMIIFGSVAALAAWVIGPGKGIHAASLDGVAPRWLAPVNRYGVPYRMMWLQVAVFIGLMLLEFLVPQRLLFYVLTAMTTQLALVAYIVMFVSAIVLRFTHAETPRFYKVPGGNIGIIILSVLGITSCLAAITTGFLIPTQILDDQFNPWVLRCLMLIGLVLISLVPLFFKKRSR